MSQKAGAGICVTKGRGRDLCHKRQGQASVSQKAGAGICVTKGRGRHLCDKRQGQGSVSQKAGAGAHDRQTGSLVAAMRQREHVNKNYKLYKLKLNE